MCWVTVLPLVIGAHFLLKVQCVRLRGVWDDILLDIEYNICNIFLYLYFFNLKQGNSDVSHIIFGTFVFQHYTEAISYFAD